MTAWPKTVVECGPESGRCTFVRANMMKEMTTADSAARVIRKDHVRRSGPSFERSVSRSSSRNI